MNPSWIRSRLPIVAVVLSALVATACSPAPSVAPGATTGSGATSGPGGTSGPGATTVAGGPKKGGSITVAIEGEPASMDPAFDYDFVSGLAVSSVTEGLLKFCENDTKLCPNLAESYTVSPDGKTYTLKIRQGVKFHDGSTMSADDVVFSLNRIRDTKLASYVGWMLANVADVQSPDASTVVITMTQPDALVEYALAATSAHVVSKKFVEANGDKYGTPDVGSIGTGPFKFVEWKSGDHQKIARFDDYWDKTAGPYLDEVTIRIIPEPSTRVAGLQTGDIDYIINNIPSDQYATVQGFADVDMTFTDSYYGEWITFNTQKAPFDNVKARQAMNYAFDKKAVRELFYGTDTPATKATLVNPTLWPTLGDSSLWQTAWDALPAYDYNQATAQQLLNESGVKDQLQNKEIAYYESTPSIKGAAEAFIDAMGKLGVTIKARKVTYQESVSLQFGEHNDYDIIVASWGSDFPDPSGNLRPNFASENSVAGGANVSNYHNAQVDALLKEQNELVDKTERAKKLIEAQRLIAEDSPIIVTAYPGWPLAVNKRLAGASAASLWYWGSLFKDIYVK
ncbi:MAG TPA: ABC transporter substrate-binding protein [Candidatus Limnocylindria bacterium]|nr:ABC transporter substrate-binding protein [Candidatus Limnocylindria bacterium]